MDINEKMTPPQFQNALKELGNPDNFIVVDKNSHLLKVTKFSYYFEKFIGILNRVFHLHLHDGTEPTLLRDSIHTFFDKNVEDLTDVTTFNNRSEMDGLIANVAE